MNFGPYSFEPSNLDKVLFPEEGYTKKDLIDYYVDAADYFLPYAKDRPLAMHRFPDGIGGKDFFQKDVPDYFPDWIDTIEVERKESGPIHMVLANKQATLAYLANQACITPHLFLSRADALHRPDKLIFDLDPLGDDFGPLKKAARALREKLSEAYNLQAFVMTTGSRGLHVVAPLRPDHTFEEVREKARAACQELADRFPDEFTLETRKDQRRGRLFLDYLRNAYGQHSVAPYAIRALSHAPIATPLSWDELDDLAAGARSYRLDNIRQRWEQKGDPWKGMRRHAGSLKG